MIYDAGILTVTWSCPVRPGYTPAGDWHLTDDLGNKRKGKTASSIGATTTIDWLVHYTGPPPGYVDYAPGSEPIRSLDGAPAPPFTLPYTART